MTEIRPGWHQSLDGQMLYVDTTYEYSSVEHWGMHLLNVMAERLRSSLGESSEFEKSFGAFVPEGPHFVYESSNSLFATRRGRGPLFVSWDTNILIYYFQYAKYFWQGCSLGERLSALNDDFVAELEGIQLVLALSVLRDIRFVILPESIDDAKKRLAKERRIARIQAFHEFTRALQLVSSGIDFIDAPSRDGLLVLPDTELDRAVSHVPAGFDRILVRSAARRGMHIFLTMDRDVLAQRAHLKKFGLFLASPLDLFEELFACGAFHCMLNPKYANFPMPDQMRAGHLIRALRSE